MSRLSLKGHALKFLAMREHSRLELRRKLLPHARRACAVDADTASARGVASRAKDGIDNDSDADAPMVDEASVGPCLDKLLDWLEANELLSQERFVESRVRVRASRFGTSRIKRELAQHGVDLPPVLRGELERSEFERAFQVWSRKFELAEDAAERSKQTRFLAARGFSSDAVRRVVWGKHQRRDDDEE